MRQNKMTKVMALMLSFVMITSVFVGNTLSRYVTSVSSTDSARVAVWGINGETVTMELFKTDYDLDGKKIAEANLNDDGVTRDKIIAPGTGGQSAFSIINYENDEIPPEVAYQVTINLDDSQVDPKIVNNTSIQWKLDDGSWGTFDALKTSLLSLSGHESGNFNYMPGTFADAFKDDVEHKIYWQWALDGNNIVDTQMGNDALSSDIGVKISVTITAQQTDDLVTNENLLDGANQIVNFNDVQPLTFRSKSDIGNFQRVEVNNETVDPSNYEVEEGSTIIKLNKDYLKTLKIGSYIISIISSDMTASTRFSVKEAPIVHNGIIPEGGTYYVKVTGSSFFENPVTGDVYYDYYPGDYEGATKILTAGDNFPETVNVGDVYVYGDYEYRYNMEYESLNWGIDTSLNGWGVLYIGGDEVPGRILTSINNKNIITVSNTFYGNDLVVKSPIIPETVKYMVGTFMHCHKLINAPEIPKNVIDMGSTFEDCTSLVNAPVIPNSVTNIEAIFYECINLTGTVEINANLDINDRDSFYVSLGDTCIYKIIGSISDELKQAIAEESGINLCEVIDGGDISKTGVYYVGVTGTNVGDYSGVSSKYINGAFPEIVNTGDVYVYGDYEYRYNMDFQDGVWNENTQLNGWGVRVLDNLKSEYGEILTSINGEDIVSLNYTFSDCYNMSYAPIIPETVVNMKGTFISCSLLEIAPVIPNGVKDLSYAFGGLSLLYGDSLLVIPSSVDDITGLFTNSNVNGTVVINGNPTKYESAFYGCYNSVILTGSSTILNEIAATNLEGNVTVQ